MADWIGKVQSKSGSEAVLRGDGVWASSNKDLERMLNASFNPFDGTGPDLVMPFGVMAVSRAAAALGGKYELAEEVPPPEPGVLY
jgi:hypothetical protein